MLEGSVKCSYLSEAEWRLEEKDLCEILNIKLIGMFVLWNVLQSCHISRPIGRMITFHQPGVLSTQSLIGLRGSGPPVP